MTFGHFIRDSFYDSTGNSVMNPGEECDDGNSQHSDGCSPACSIEEVCSVDVAVRCSALQCVVVCCSVFKIVNNRMGVS